MKTLRLYTLFLLVSIASVAFAINLPTFSFYDANELYAENQDNIEMAGGIKINSVNRQILTANEGWGADCLEQGEQGACQDCCKLQLLTNGVSEQNLIYYSTCMKVCGGGPSLPLGSVLCLLPFALGYGVVKRFKKKQ